MWAIGSIKEDYLGYAMARMLHFSGQIAHFLSQLPSGLMTIMMIERKIPHL